MIPLGILGASAAGGGSSGWSPYALNPVEWWDFSDAGTRTDISGAVSAISNKVSGGRTASQNVTGSRPSLSLAAQNGRDVAVFDGSNDSLNLSSSLATSSTMTVVEVFRRSSSSIRSIILGGSSGGVPPYSTMWLTDNIRYSALWGSGGGYATHGGSSTSTGVFASVIVKGASTSMYIDGTLSGSAQVTGSGSGSITSIGRRGADYSNGWICEIFVFDSALSSSDREKMEGYVAHKWGIASKLPAGHPYKSAPPE